MITQRLKSVPRTAIAFLSLGLTLGIGWIDYITDPRISFSVGYLVPIGLAAWYVNSRFALFISALSVAVWVGGDLAGRQLYDNLTTPFWNAVIRMLFYSVIVWLCGSLIMLQRELETRVKERTAALTKGLREQQRLQAEVLRVSEREQLRIGQDLHDSLCQHLTGTAFAGEVLRQKLSARQAPEEEDARRVVRLIEDSILLSRRLARGLHPLEETPDGLMLALGEFAVTTSSLFNLSCTFECDSPVMIREASAAAHLYRITQEAVGNAVKHAKPSLIAIALEEQEECILLRVEDNGKGLWPRDVTSTGMPPGLGLRIMAHRAGAIGASFETRPRPGGGTIVTCKLPSSEAIAAQ